MKHKLSKYVKIKSLLPVAFTFIGIVILLVLIISVSNSLFFSAKERINIVVFGKQTMFFSIDMQDNIDYIVEFYPDMKVSIPGGYGTYRIGALGKLISLEKKPTILQKTFTALTSTFVDFYFYPKNSDVYYGGRDDEKLLFPGFFDVLHSNSNVGLFDKIYLTLLFSKESQKQYKRLRSLPADDFFKQYQGYFYRNSYRKEKKNVQILYNFDYKTAETIGTMLEGNGIKVSDYTIKSKQSKQCVITEQTNSFSQTAKDMANFFGCSLKIGKTDVYDIIFSIGNLEQSWEVSS